MFCLKKASVFEDTIKKSRFIGILLPCHNGEAEITTNLQRLYTEHATASHIAYAYRIKSGNGIITRFNDAGEPSGTAGKPILQHLAGKQLMNALLVVIRYFGGIKLGAGGLTRAYGNTARQVIELGEIYPYIEYVQQQFQLDYKQLQSLEYALKKLDGEIIEQQFSETIQLTIKLPKEHLPQLIEVLSIR